MGECTLQPLEVACASASSSAMTADSPKSPPEPPYSSGRSTPSMPASPSLCQNLRSTACCRAHCSWWGCSACVGILLRAFASRGALRIPTWHDSGVRERKFSPPFTDAVFGGRVLVVAWCSRRADWVVACEIVELRDRSQATPEFACQCGAAGGLVATTRACCGRSRLSRRGPVCSHRRSRLQPL
jgi:hypothetical protein